VGFGFAPYNTSDFHLKQYNYGHSSSSRAHSNLGRSLTSHSRDDDDDDVHRACKKYSSCVAQIGSDSRIRGKGRGGEPSPQVGRERERESILGCKEKRREVKMMLRCGVILLLFLHSLAFVCEASYGDEQPSYKYCVEGCEKNGCVNGLCFDNCKSSVNISANGKPYLRWTLDTPQELLKWDCTGECRYQCMLQEESSRDASADPIKYHGKWPFLRILNIQEPASVGFSILNLLVHFQGLSSFLVLLYYKLPLRPKGPYYEYVGLWTIFGLLSMNSWIWSSVFHSRDVKLTESLDYSSAVALLGYSLILAIIRTGSLRIEAARVMVAAPIIAFVTTHILYLNLYKFDYGLNMIVCVVIGVLQLIIWAVWGLVTKHPARYKLWTVILATALAMLLEIFDFPPVWGIFDAHSIWHAATLPITYLWWSFIKDDAIIRTTILAKKSEAVAGDDTRKTQ